MHIGRMMITAAIAVTVASPVVAETKWDLPLVWPADNYISVETQKFADAVKTATKGEVVITLHAGGSLGYKGPDMFSAVRDGLVPIGDMLLQQQVGDGACGLNAASTPGPECLTGPWRWQHRHQTAGIGGR